MTLDDFLDLTEERIPTVEEMALLCDHLGIGFAKNAEGSPVLCAKDGNRDEAQLLAGLFCREPFRSAVIQMRLCDEASEIRTDGIRVGYRPNRPATNFKPAFIIQEVRNGLAERGAKLVVEDGSVFIRGDLSAVTRKLIILIEQYRPEIMRSE